MPKVVRTKKPRVLKRVIVWGFSLFWSWTTNLKYDMYDIGICVNCNWVDTRWQQYSTHLHTNNTQNNTSNIFGWKAFWDSNPEWSN